MSYRCRGRTGITAVTTTAPHAKRNQEDNDDDEDSSRDAPAGAGHHKKRRVQEKEEEEMKPRLVGGPAPDRNRRHGRSTSNHCHRHLPDFAGADDDDDYLVVDVTTTTTQGKHSSRGSIVRFAYTPPPMQESGGPVVLNAAAAAAAADPAVSIRHGGMIHVGGTAAAMMVSSSSSSSSSSTQQKKLLPGALGIGEEPVRTWYTHQEYQYFMKDRQDTVRVYQSVRGDMTHLQDHYTIQGLEHLLDLKLYLELQQYQKRLVATVVQAQRQKLSAEAIRHVSLHYSAASTLRALGKAGVVASHPAAAPAAAAASSSSSTLPIQARLLSPKKSSKITPMGNPLFIHQVRSGTAFPPHLLYHYNTNAAMTSTTTTSNVNLSMLQLMNSKLLQLQRLQSSLALPPPCRYTLPVATPFTATTAAELSSSPRRARRPAALLYSHTTYPSLHADAEPGLRSP